MDKQNVMYLYNGMLFNHKKEQKADIHYNMLKPWKHYAKKPVAKHIMTQFNEIFKIGKSIESRLVAIQD